LLLGAIAAAIVLSWFEGRVRIPPWAFVIAQGFVGCLVARSITPDIVVTIVRKWPMFLGLIGAVILFAAVLGYVLARWKVLPGTTAVWGSWPGAATAMVLMADGFGGDMRLVAVMQYLRVACVGLVASIVARAWSASGGAAPAAIDWFPPLAAGPLLGTVALGVGGAVIGMKARIPAGPLLLPLFVGAPLSAGHMLTITLPPWLLAICYALVGWSIGLRFTREIVLYAGKQLPRILASIFTLIAMCGALGFALHEAAGTDALTAYLATSPGGADAVAIIAASSPVDIPFVMAMQIGRLLMVILIGPSLARMIARWTQ
ncbi:MAG: AbrB family transcriptional regulator, partial [Roseiarcus sp.]